MWPSGKNFFSRSSSSSSPSSTKNSRDKVEKEKERGGTRKAKTRSATLTPTPTSTLTSTPHTRPVERPLIPAAKKLASVPAYLRSSPPAEREMGGFEGEGGSVEVPVLARGRVVRRESSCSPPSPSQSPLHPAAAGLRRDGADSATPRSKVTTEETVVTIEEASSGTLTGDESEEDESYFESEGKMSLGSLIHPPPPGFERHTLLKREKEEEEGITISPETMGDAFMAVFHSQSTSVKARIEMDLGSQRREYHTRYRHLPHAERTADIHLLTRASLPTATESETQTEETASVIESTLPPSEHQHQHKKAHKLLARHKSAWHLRKYMLFDSPAYKNYVVELDRKHGDPSERDNCLEFFFGHVLGAAAAVEGDEEEVDWSLPILHKRRELVEHGVRCREGREEDGRGAMYAVSGPAVRRKRLAEAEERFCGRGVRLDLDLDVKGEETFFKSMSLRLPELRMRRGRTESMAVTVGGTPERDYSTLDDIGLGHLSAERLAGFGLDSPLSEASERDDAHVDALRFALGGLSRLHQHQYPHPHQSESPTRTSPNDSARLHVNHDKENASIPSSRDARRQTKIWEPISTTDQHHESPDRAHHRKSRRDSRDEKRGSDSDDTSDESGSDAEMEDARERLSEGEIEEARRIVDEAEARKKKKKNKKAEARGEADLELELERGRDKTSVERSFPDRMFF